MSHLTREVLFGQAAPQQGPPPWASLMPIVLLFVVFYFLLIRPQQKKAKELDAQVKSLKPGDRITTSGGIIGVVVAVKEKSLSIRSAETKLEILKSSVAAIDRDPEPASA